MQAELETLCAQRKAAPRKVTIESLPEAKRPSQLRALSKMLSDAVKMLAYRAETAMVALLRCHLKKEEDTRALIREWLVSSGDIQPNAQTKTLTIRIHGMANPVDDRAIAALLENLNSQEFAHPETRVKMTFPLV